MWGVFYIIMLVSQNIVMELNNVMVYHADTPNKKKALQLAR